jgi:hypothetical protein
MKFRITVSIHPIQLLSSIIEEINYQFFFFLKKKKIVIDLLRENYSMLLEMMMSRKKRYLKIKEFL